MASEEGGLSVLYAEGIDLVRLAVRTGLYPVCQIFDGDRVVINVEPTPDDGLLEKYFSLQGRFRKGAVKLDAVRAGSSGSGRGCEGAWAERGARGPFTRPP